MKVKVINLVHLWVYANTNNLSPDQSNDLVVNNCQCKINIVK